MLRPSPNHGTQRLPNDDDDDDVRGYTSFTRNWLTRGQYYKEKHKLDSKQISNSPC